MIRVLHVVGGLSRGGTETTIMNLYRHIDRQIIQFDFISHNIEMNDYEDDIRNLGGKIYHIPKFNGINIGKYVVEWNEFFARHKEYSLLHSHVWSTASIFLPIAKKNGVYSIIHSHSVSAGDGLAAIGRGLLKPPIKYMADYYMACTEEAGRWLFGNKIIQGDHFSVLPNAIDTQLYRFNKVVRKSIREKYNVSDCIVIGHIGTFNTNKNQAFIIELFKTIHQLKPQSVLWLIGDGKLKHSIENTVTDYKLSDHVVFWGIRNDIPDLLQAMDVFIFPSKHESFGNAALEAEAMGIPTVCSTNIPREAAADQNVQYISLNEPERWVEAITKCAEIEGRNYNNVIQGTKLDIKVTVKWLQDFYLKILEEKKGE